MSESNRIRIYVTELKYIEELKDHVRIFRYAEKTVWKEAIYVSLEAIPCQMDVWNITCEGRSLSSSV